MNIDRLAEVKQAPLTDLYCVSCASILVWAAAGRTLNNTDRMQSTTFAAYSASHPDVWNTEPSHFCCTMHQRGCPTSAGKAKAPAYASN